MTSARLITGLHQNNVLWDSRPRRKAQSSGAIYRFGSQPNGEKHPILMPKRDVSADFVTRSQSVLGSLPGPLLKKLQNRQVAILLVPDVFAGLRGITRYLVRRADKSARAEDDTFRAMYLPLTNRIVIPEYALTGRPQDVPIRIPNAQLTRFDFFMLHEIGHAVDYSLGPPKFNLPILKHLFPTFSTEAGFVEAYGKDIAQHRENLPHGVSSPTEAFATLFACLFLPQQTDESRQILARFPMTKAYIEAAVLPWLMEAESL